MKIRRPEFPNNLDRRNFLKLGSAYALYELLNFQFHLETAKHLEILHHVIEMPRLDKKRDPTYIVHLSDMHLSTTGVDFMNPAILKEYIPRLNSYLRSVGAEKKNTIVIETGDKVSMQTGANRPTPLSVLSESLGYIKKIPASLYASVEGNHEVGHPQTNEIVKLVKKYGFLSLGLQNQDNYFWNSDSLPFTLVGLPDFTTRRESWYQADGGSKFLQALTARNIDKPMVFATHTSMYDSFRNGALKGLVHNSLFLHGHTHGGQIAGNTPLEYCAGKYAVYGSYSLRKGHLRHKGPTQTSKYYRGVYQVSGNNVIAISPGLGHAPAHGVRLVPPGAEIIEVRAV